MKTFGYSAAKLLAAVQIPLQATLMTYAGAAGLAGVTVVTGVMLTPAREVVQEAIQPVLFIECPALLFPFVRRLVADLSREGGFPPLLLDPIDFASLYRRRAEQGQQPTITD